MAGVGAAALLPGCNKDGGSDDLFGTDGNSASASASAGDGDASMSGSDEAGEAGESGTDEGGDDGPKFDVGNDSDLPNVDCGENPNAPDCQGCTAVDILFVVDNSGSMQVHAPAVEAAFDPFVNAMVDELPPSTSLHVGVTRGTGFYDPGNSGGFNGNDCTGQTDGVWNPPDTGMNTGTNGHQGRLWEQDGQRYFELETGQNPAQLKQWFGAALSGAIDGFANYSNSETVVAGAAYAFHPANDSYNAGFLREQAVLVIFLLSDSPDLSPANVATADFVSMVSDAKSACGDMCVLTTGAISAGCYDPNKPGIANTRIYDFMNGFGQPPVSYVELPVSGGTPDLAAVLGSALSGVIGETCEQIPPAG